MKRLFVLITIALIFAACEQERIPARPTTYDIQVNIQHTGLDAGYYVLGVLGDTLIHENIFMNCATYQFDCRTGDTIVFHLSILNNTDEATMTGVDLKTGKTLFVEHAQLYGTAAHHQLILQ